MRMTERERLQDDLLKDQWMWNYSWRGVKLASLEKGYGVPRAEILPMMRDIAHTHDPPYAAKLPTSRCRSCGMRIFWGKLNGNSHPFDPKIVVIGTDAGTIERGRGIPFRFLPECKGT